MLPNGVTITRRRQSFEFDDHSRPITVFWYDWKAGPHGPYSLKLYAGEDSPGEVEKRINVEVAKLRALGMLPGETQ